MAFGLHLRRWLLAWGLGGALVVAAGGTLAQTPGQTAGPMPTEAEFEAALGQARPGAARAGLRLRSDGLWLALLQARTPLLAARQGQDCHIGYTTYTPGAAMGWLFPPGSAAERTLWLSGLVRHEIAHCVLHGVGAAAADASAPHSAVNHTPGPHNRQAGADAVHVAWRAEVLADLAFALHVDSQPGGAPLIEHLAQLRAHRGRMDPLHDASAALRCYLQHPLRQAQEDPDLSTLVLWGQRCLPG